MTKCNIKGAGYRRIHSRCESPGCRGEGPGDVALHVYADHFLLVQLLPVFLFLYVAFLVKMLTLNLSLYVLTNEDHQSRVSIGSLSISLCNVGSDGLWSF